MTDTLQPFRTVREILRHVLALHRRTLRGCDYPPGIDARHKAVLDHLRACEIRLIAGIARYEDGDDDVLDTFVQGVPVASIATADAHGEVRGDIQEILDRYRSRDRALIDLYDQLAASLFGPRAKEIFAGLAELERRNQSRLQEGLLDF
jgi:hypothetical protein